MSRNITFTRENYEYFKEVAGTGQKDFYKGDFLGEITEGAVSCVLTIEQEDNSSKKLDYCYGDNGFCIWADVDILLDKDGAYETESTFFVYVKDTYEKTLKNIEDQLAEIIECVPKLQEGIRNTELTWEMLPLA